MAKVPTGNEVEIEDENNPEATVDAEMNGEVTQESNAEQTADEAAKVEEDLTNAGVNTSELEDKRAKKRQKNALMKKVGELGETFGASKTCMIELAAEVTEAAVSKTIGEDDAEELYKAFKARADKRATTDAGMVPDDEVETQTQQVSKLRGFIKLGNQMEEAVDIVQRAIAVHLAAKAVNAKAVMKGSTYTVLGSIVTEQMRDKYAGVPMTDEQMGSHIAREVVEAGPITAATKVRQALDAALSAGKGNGSDKNYRAPLVSQNLDDAIDALYRALGDASPEAQAAYDKEVADAKAAADLKEAKKNKKAA